MFRVRCHSCCEVYLETTEDFDPERTAAGTMFRFTEQYGPNGYNWSLPFSPYDMADGVECPGCGAPIVGLDGKIDPADLIIVKDFTPKDYEGETITVSVRKEPPERVEQPVSAHVCAECGKTFKNAYGLRGHMRAHGR